MRHNPTCRPGDSDDRPEQLLELTCLPVEPTVVVTPAVSAPIPPDVAATRCRT